jgi:hypothetical protein
MRRGLGIRPVVTSPLTRPDAISVDTAHTILESADAERGPRNLTDAAGANADPVGQLSHEPTPSLPAQERPDHRPPPSEPGYPNSIVLLCRK